MRDILGGGVLLLDLGAVLRADGPEGAGSLDELDRVLAGRSLAPNGGAMLVELVLIEEYLGEPGFGDEGFDPRERMFASDGPSGLELALLGAIIEHFGPAILFGEPLVPEQSAKSGRWVCLDGGPCPAGGLCANSRFVRG